MGHVYSMAPFVCFSCSVPFSCEASLYVAKLCRNQECNDPQFPLLDYDEDKESCVCMAHPCWNDNGQRHSCETRESPFLMFSYDKDGVLSCHCAAAQQASSVYIASRKCPGQHCFDQAENPVLDWDDNAGECG